MLTDTALTILDYAPSDFGWAVTFYERIAEVGLIGCWRVDAGTLNRIVILQSVPTDNSLPTGEGRSLAQTMRTKHLTRLPLPATQGPTDQTAFYEFREYRFRVEAIPDLVDRWRPALLHRAALAPFLGAWFAVHGEFCDLFHLWGYEDAAAWQRVRSEARRLGVWPPVATKVDRFRALSQSSAVLLPIRVPLPPAE